jgi:hypothetical protein
MNKPKTIEYILFAILLIGANLHRIFDGTGIKADIFAFYDYGNDGIRFSFGEAGRYMSNILYEVGCHIAKLSLSLMLFIRFKRLFYLVILIYLFLELISYILFYGQGTNLYVYSLTLLFIIYAQIWKYYDKRRKKKMANLGRSNNRDNISRL